MRMREEERVCVVLYKRVDNDYVHYGVLKRTKNWDGWEIIKGHMEADGPAATARQEVAEEAGITDIVDIQPIDHTVEWTYEDDGDEVNAVCDCFLVEVPSDARIDVSSNPHDEHEHGFFLNYRDARDILTYDDQRELLDAAHEVLEDGT